MSHNPKLHYKIYNKVNNITSIQSDMVRKAFGFDKLDRLTHYEDNTTKEYQNFSYDANGNRLSQNQETNRTRRFSYTANSNTLTGIKYYHTIDENTTNITKDINYTYDATGNIIQDEKHTYSYDARNRLIAIDNNVTYQYNYDNRRVSKTVNGVTTYFIYDGHKLLGEYDQNGDLIKEYLYYNSTPIAVITPTTIEKIYADHLDTPRRVADNANNIVWKWESSPFGESKPTGTYTLNLRFPGQYFDSESGTHYNINRDYNPVTGRYIQSDPIGFDGGVNGYLYAAGNSLIYKDINGLQTNFKFTGYSYTVIAGGTGVMGTYDDWNYSTGRRRIGHFIAGGDAWGLDTGVNGGSGVIWGDDSYTKFMGWSKTWTLSFWVSGGYIEDMQDNSIGLLYGVGVRFSFSYSETYTRIMPGTTERDYYDYN